MNKDNQEMSNIVRRDLADLKRQKFMRLNYYDGPKCGICKKNYPLTKPQNEATEDNYNRFPEGIFLAIPPETHGETFYCTNCLPGMNGLITELFPQCAVCRRPCTTSITVSSDYNGYNHTKEESVCSSICRQMKEADESTKAEQTRLRIAEYAKTNNPPEQPPLFTKEPHPHDPAIVFLITTLDRKTLNDFLRQVNEQIANFPWLPIYDRTQHQFTYVHEPLKPIHLHDFPTKGANYLLQTPLPAGLWDWIREKAGQTLTKPKKKKKA